MDVVVRGCYDLLMIVFSKFNNFFCDDESFVDMCEEDERFCELLKEACATVDEDERETVDEDESEMIDKDECDLCICVFLKDYCDCVYCNVEVYVFDVLFCYWLYRGVDR